MLATAYPEVPFTITADLDLGDRVGPYIRQNGADVRICRGTVPESLPDAEAKLVAYQYAKGRVLIKPMIGLRFLIENGETILYNTEARVDPRDVLLFLLGSAWGALIYQRGLLPLHASAISHGEDIYAFTGPSGAGKSTLAAALAGRGHPFFTDDILIIDPRALVDRVPCYAGQKDLKLWHDAFKLTQAIEKGSVRSKEDFKKMYADPKYQSERTAGTLKSLFILGKQNTQNNTCGSIRSVSGRASVEQLLRSVYRPRYGYNIVGRRQIYQWMAALIQHIQVSVFSRPMVSDLFHEGVESIVTALPEPGRHQ